MQNSVDWLPASMRRYEYTFGQPLAFLSTADRLDMDRGWVIIQHDCTTAEQLLERLGSGAQTITLDCSFFVQLVLACRRAEPFSRVRFGTGPYAMRLLCNYTPTDQERPCFLALPKELHDQFKTFNSACAQFLVGPDATGRYIGMANKPRCMTVDEWRQYLETAFCENANECTNSGVRAWQLACHAQGDIRWDMRVIDAALDATNASLNLRDIAL